MNSLNLLWRFFGRITNKSAIGSYGSANYTHIAPLGLKRWGPRFSIDILKKHPSKNPRWGLFLSLARVSTDAAETPFLLGRFL